MSKHIANLKVGDTLEMKGPIPKYNWEENKVENVGMIAGGTGITPMVSLFCGDDGMASSYAWMTCSCIYLFSFLSSKSSARSLIRTPLIRLPRLLLSSPTKPRKTSCSRRSLIPTLRNIPIASRLSTPSIALPRTGKDSKASSLLMPSRSTCLLPRIRMPRSSSVVPILCWLPSLVLRLRISLRVRSLVSSRSK